MAGTAFGALLVPACMTPGGGPDALRIPPPSPPAGQVGYRPMPGALALNGKKPREQFAVGREEPTTTLTARPTAVPDPGKAVAQVGSPVPEEAPMPHPVETPAAPGPTLPTADPMAVPTTAPPESLPLSAEPPRLPGPLLGSPVPAIDPTTDADGVIRPPKPVIPGAAPVLADTPPITGPVPALPTAPPMPAPGPAAPAAPPMLAPGPGLPTAPPMPPPLETMPRAKTDESPMLVIPPATGAPPFTPIPGAVTPPIKPIPAGPALGPAVHEAKASPVADDSALLKAVRAFQANRPHEAVEHLKAFDDPTQQVLLALMPAMVRLTEGRLQSMKPEEMDRILDQIAKVSPVLRPRASLRASHVRLCREVHTFAHVEPFPAGHVFRPGDVVHLYMELANYTNVPDSRGGYRIELSSSLELRDGNNAVAWRADPKDVPDRVSTPPQDYYRAFRLAVPHVPPGTYTLAIKTTDRPTGRESRSMLEVRIGSR
jgi:hypothetical protein